MAESIIRTLRDGALEGELATSLTIKDTIASPLAFHVFSHIISQLSSLILAAKSQSRGLVIIAFYQSPSFYFDLLKLKGVDVSASQTWIHILDCYTDPLGWKDKTRKAGNVKNLPHQSSLTTTNKNVKDMDKLFSVITELGRGLVGDNKGRITVAIDSLSDMLRHASLQSVAGLLSNLHSHDQISSMFGLLHSDLHEERATSVLEYMSSMVASVEPLHHSVDGVRVNLETLSEENFTKGKLNVRFKRRNGRVRVMCEEFKVEQNGINFTSISSGEGTTISGLLPKVQFNLQLSEKERNDRANVVLPFEHQGNGRPIQIYDGRKSLGESNAEATSSVLNSNKEDTGMGEIIYYRDSDDEMPDSDEDPDDDLDI